MWLARNGGLIGEGDSRPQALRMLGFFFYEEIARQIFFGSNLQKIMSEWLSENIIFYLLRSQSNGRGRDMTAADRCKAHNMKENKKNRKCYGRISKRKGAQRFRCVDLHKS